MKGVYMATTDFIKQGELIRFADIVSAFDEKENIFNKKTTLTNSTTDYPSTSLLTTQLALKANNADAVKLNGDQTIEGIKTFSISPTVPSKDTAVGNYPTVIATEAQVALKANNADVVKLYGNQTIESIKTFLISPVVPSKSAVVGNNPTSIATEAQVQTTMKDYGYNLIRSGSTLSLLTINGNREVQIGFFPMPDYVNADQIHNHITFANGSWTNNDQGDGYVRISISGSGGNSNLRISINNTNVVSFREADYSGNTEQILPIKNGDTVAFSGSSGGHSTNPFTTAGVWSGCYFIPIKWIQVSFTSP